MSTCDTNKKVTNKAGLKRPLEFTMFCNHKVLVVGGGIMGLGTAFLLSERGFQVTLLEKNQEVAKEASYINGSMICPSMCASWASLGLLAKVRNVVLQIDSKALNILGSFFFICCPTNQCLITCIPLRHSCQASSKKSNT